jgi:hypothetical protein
LSFRLFFFYLNHVKNAKTHFLNIFESLEVVMDMACHAHSHTQTYYNSANGPNQPSGGPGGKPGGAMDIASCM